MLDLKSLNSGVDASTLILCLFQFVIGVPSSQERLDVLRSLTHNLPLSSDVDLELLSKQCVGYVAADLTALVRQSTTAALTTTLHNKETGI